MAKFYISHEEWYPVLELCENDDGSFPDTSLTEIPDELVVECRAARAAHEAVQEKLWPLFEAHRAALNPSVPA